MGSTDLSEGHKKRGDFSKSPQDNENETWIILKLYAIS